MKLDWMKMILGVLHDNKCMDFHGLLDIVLDPSRRDESNIKLRALEIN